ncbi:putative GTP-binding protein 6 isoform X2 [Stegodyphus dumicola]|uniref:putative GTP-binding protein 6 isoform X2 n=1 Tax=Stegodyphus dumicola TaxID=202533 RepID=UPI0015B25E1E|nr:putative GTP-binding protein 6 isoform X2 [Stegodyphus dumicola]
MFRIHYVLDCAAEIRNMKKLNIFGDIYVKGMAYTSLKHTIYIRRQFSKAMSETWNLLLVKTPQFKFNQNYLKQFKYHTFFMRTIICSSRLSNEKNNLEKIERESLLEHSEFADITKHLYKHPGVGHNILLIQPRGRGPQRESISACERKLDEAVALVKTLPDWNVVEKYVIRATNLKSKLIFGKGNLENLKNITRSNPSISAVFIGIDIMTALQNSELEKYFQMQVFDRYQIILQIFHDHAHTKEAKLQLALAEIPYLRVKLSGYSYTRNTSYFSGIEHVGGDGETYMEMRRRLLNEREIKLKKALEKVKNQRELLRRSDRRNSLPVVAIVGYTNCGKTTLIKSLTDDERLLPEDKLFATLDVTFHAGMLPSNQKVLYIDTVGFISDVPTALIQSFRSTLEEITLADVVVHVRDISHPDTEAQKETVLKTLAELDLPSKLLDSVIEVQNKVDLIERFDTMDSNALLVSAVHGTGLPDLLEVLEQKLFENTGHSVVLVRVPNGGDAYRNV